MPRVFVIAQDWSLRTGVRAELREMGVEALGMESVADGLRAVAEGTLPDAVVLDSAAAVPAVEEIAALARRFPVLLVASRTEPRPEIPGAAVLWRPVSVGEVIQQVRHLLGGRVA